METFLFSLSARTDEKFLRLSAVGRLLFVQAAASLDGNWGHGLFCRTAVVANAFPTEQRAADSGDRAARAWIAEALKQLALAISLGLFMVEDTPAGPVIAYRQWERYHGGRRNRGQPYAPMGPAIAATRDWTRISAGSRQGLARWAEQHGLDLGRSMVAPWSDHRTTTERPEGDHSATTERLENDRGATMVVADLCLGHVPMPGPLPPNGTRRTDEDDWPPSSCSMPPEAVALVKRVGARHPRQIVTDHRLRPELPKRLADFQAVTDCETWEVWCVSCALMAQAENRGEWIKKGFDAAIRDHACPGLSYRQAARKLLGLDAPADSPDAAPVLRPAMVCPACGWTDPPGGSERFCASCMSDLVPDETQGA